MDNTLLSKTAAAQRRKLPAIAKWNIARFARAVKKESGRGEGRASAAQQYRTRTVFAAAMSSQQENPVRLHRVSCWWTVQDSNL